jgi:hypothetical protein
MRPGRRPVFLVDSAVMAWISGYRALETDNVELATDPRRRVKSTHGDRRKQRDT